MSKTPQLRVLEGSAPARLADQLLRAIRAPRRDSAPVVVFPNPSRRQIDLSLLMRLGEAVEELQGAEGLLVHRSHWVAFSGVRAHRRDKGRDILQMSDGAEVPVSRSNKAAAQAAGLF